MGSNVPLTAQSVGCLHCVLVNGQSAANDEDANDGHANDGHANDGHEVMTEEPDAVDSGIVVGADGS